MNVGLISLSTDITIEKDFHKHCNHDVFTTRIIFENPITKKSLFALAGQVQDAMTRFPMEMDKYVFGCTSGTAVIGEGNLPGLINPLTSADNWLKENGKKELSLFTAYTEDVSSMVKHWFEQKGYRIVNHKYLNYSDDIEIARISQDELKKQVLEFDPGCDTVFLSCTALPIIDMLVDLNEETGVDYISSNWTMLWDINK